MHFTSKMTNLLQQSSKYYLVALEQVILSIQTACWTLQIVRKCFIFLNFETMESWFWTTIRGSMLDKWEVLWLDCNCHVCLLLHPHLSYIYIYIFIYACVSVYAMTERLSYSICQFHSTKVRWSNNVRSWKTTSWIIRFANKI